MTHPQVHTQGHTQGHTPVAGTMAGTNARASWARHATSETHGAEAELLAKEVGMAVLKLVKILEELQRDGIVVAVTNTQRKTFWSLKGINPGSKRHPR